MEQTIIKVSNSLAITIPSHFVKDKKLKAGQKIFVKADNVSDIIWISTKRENIIGISPEFKECLDKFMDEHGSALRELARR